MAAVMALWGLPARGENQNPVQMVCMGIQPYHVDPSPLPNATYNWSITPGVAGTDWQIIGSGNAITVNWMVPGSFTLSVFTSVNGCPGPAQQVVVTVVEAPVGPTLAGKIPPGMGVCDGTPVSASFNPGTGGIGCSDEFEYSYDNNGTWLSYSANTLLPTAGHTLVEIRGRRTGCDATLGCNGTPWVVLASWTVTQILPLSVTITPSSDPVCEGTVVTYTAVVTNGGANPTYQWYRGGILQPGETNPTFTCTPVDGELITCQVLSGDPCAQPNPAIGSFTPVVTPPPQTSEIWHN